ERGTARVADSNGDYHLSATTLAGLNTALSGLTIVPPVEFEGQFPFAVQVQAHDGSSDSAVISHNVTLIVDPVAEPPTAAAPAAVSVKENATNFAITGVSVGPLAEDADDTVSVTLTVWYGTLHVANSILVTGNGTASLMLPGDAAALTTLLAGLTYPPTSGYTGSDTLNLPVTSKDGRDTYPTPATKATTITIAEDSVVVTGAPAVGQTVIATFADLDNDNDTTQSITYHWYRDGVAIAGQSAATYLVTAADAGHSLSVVAFEGSHLEATSTAVTVVSSLLVWKGPAS